MIYIKRERLYELYDESKLKETDNHNLNGKKKKKKITMELNLRIPRGRAVFTVLKNRTTH